MMQLLHTALEIVILALLIFVMLKLETMHRTLDRLSGIDRDAEHLDAPPPEGNA
jgi:hypothetical protein